VISEQGQTAAITGASGYLGGVIRGRLRADGWHTIPLVRSPVDEDCRLFDISGPTKPDLLNGVDVLIHCAYDMTLRERSDIWRVNVDGTRRLLNLAADAGVGRVLVLSSMSAYEGTEQIYGQSKLEIEAHAREVGAYSLRPGLVYGPRAGGMAETLARLSLLPIVPLLTPVPYQFTVHEDDFADAVTALVTADEMSGEPIGIANPVPVPFREILEHFARQQGARCRFLPVDWRIVKNLLWLTERLRLPLPVRADSLLGLVRPAPFVPNLETLEGLGIQLRRFGQPVPP
jgi:nucleoside-diphosphate-sugar epimerase